MDLDQEQIIEITKFLLLVIASLFTYFKFFREGTHKQRIELDIDFHDLGLKDFDRIIEIGVTAENKGYVEQKFEGIRLRIRGIDNKTKLKELEGYEPHLVFPLDLGKISLISVKHQYYFVRPHVKQRFPIVLKIPENWTHILVRATFKYKKSVDFHIAERAFQIEK